MGYFTWTFADKPLKYKKDGEISRTCKLHYDGSGYLLCPDHSYFYEPDYEGYGIFDGHDAYDLVVDWNRGKLVEAITACHEPGCSHPLYDLVAEALDQNRGADIPAIIAQYGKNEGPWFKTEYKRAIGIYISRWPKLPYPIKVASKPYPFYEKLPASLPCQ